MACSVCFKLLWLNLILLLACRVLAQGHDGPHDSEALPVEAVLNARYFSQYAPLSFSADGEWLAYAVKENVRNRDIAPEEYEATGVPHYASGADIFVKNLRTGAVRNLTGGGDNWLPTWSPHGRLLAFLSDRDGSGMARLWVWDAMQNQLRMVSHENIRGAQMEWLPDSSALVVPVAPTLSDSLMTRSSSAPVQSSSQGGTPGANVRLYRGGAESLASGGAAAPWHLDRYRADLALISVRKGVAPRIVARGGRVATFFLSPDGSRVAYTAPIRFERAGSQQILFDLRVVDLHTNQGRDLLSDIRLNIGGGEFRWSPDGAWIAYITAGMEERHSDCYVVSVASGKLRKLTSFTVPASSAWGLLPLWAASENVYFLRDGQLWRASIDSDQAVLVTSVAKRFVKELVAEKPNVLWKQEGGRSTAVLAHDSVTEQDGFYRIDLVTGSMSALPESGGCYTCVVKPSSIWVSPDGRTVAFIKETADTPPDLWAADPDLAHPRRLTSLNPQLEGYRMGKSRLIEWRSDDGQKLCGTLLLPAGYREGARYPLIVWVYGGDAGSGHLDQFGVDSAGVFNMQLLATRGYAILMPAAPERAGTMMLDLAKAVLPGVSQVVDMGIADPDRVGVMGHSHGGYSTLALIVQTRRFAAAVEIDGAGDLIAAYGEMDAAGSAYGIALAEHGQDQLGGTPWQVRDKYIENSPIYYLDRISTPLLIVQGGEDTFTAPFLADEIFVGLRRLGREVEYAKYPGEGHDPDLWSYANQLDLAQRIIAWMNQHLQPSSPQRGTALGLLDTVPAF